MVCLLHLQLCYLGVKLHLFNDLGVSACQCLDLGKGQSRFIHVIGNAHGLLARHDL